MYLEEQVDSLLSSGALMFQKTQTVPPIYRIPVEGMW